MALRVMILALGLVPLLAAAEVRYVTDQLYLGLYDRPEAGAKARQTLVSGTALEILETGKHYARVRTPDGAEGWVKSAYLVAEKPPRLVLAQLQQEKQALDRHLQTTLQELEAVQRDRERLSVELQAAKTRLSSHDQEVAALREENARFRARLEDSQPRIPALWAAGGALLALVLGAVATERIIDYRVRRRHGGFRIY